MILSFFLKYFHQAFVLAVASGVTMLHGPLLRHLTTGQLPVTALMSSDNGKAQVEYLAIFLGPEKVE